MRIPQGHAESHSVLAPVTLKVQCPAGETGIVLHGAKHLAQKTEKLKEDPPVWLLPYSK